MYIRVSAPYEWRGRMKIKRLSGLLNCGDCYEVRAVELEDGRQGVIYHYYNRMNELDPKIGVDAEPYGFETIGEILNDSEKGDE